MPRVGGNGRVVLLNSTQSRTLAQSAGEGFERILGAMPTPELAPGARKHAVPEDPHGTNRVGMKALAYTSIGNAHRAWALCQQIGNFALMMRAASLWRLGSSERPPNRKQVN